MEFPTPGLLWGDPITCRCLIHLPSSPTGCLFPWATALTSSTVHAAGAPRAVAPAEAGPGIALGQVELVVHAGIGLLADELGRRVLVEACPPVGCPCPTALPLVSAQRHPLWPPGTRYP